MALNCVMLSPGRAPIPLPNELNIRTIDSGVEFALTIPDAPPSGSSSSGGSGGARKLKDVGRLWLTDQRLIFVSDGENKSSLESLSIPLTSLLSTKFEQPYFGSNYLSIDIKPAPDGGLAEGTKAEIRFRDKGLFEFVSVLEKTRERAVYMKRQSMDDDEGLPTYTPAEAGPSDSGGIPDDAPPGYDA